MKYIEEFRRNDAGKAILKNLAAETDPGRTYRFMEFCGGHTHAIYRYGLLDLLPGNIEMVHGPGCPVCVLPKSRLDAAIFLAKEPGVILCTYGDMIRVPATSRDTLYKAKAAGADVAMVYSALDSLAVARENPDRTVVFFAVGFETTTPPTASVIRRARDEGLRNFLVFSNHVLTTPALKIILDTGPSVALNGFIGPGHVSTVIGSDAYLPVVKEYRRPLVIAGFEPLDILQAVLMLVRQVNGNRFDVENEYTRSATREGNVKARALMDEVLEMRDTFGWRGLGLIPRSALKIRPTYAAFDAEARWDLAVFDHRECEDDEKGCACGEILQGRKKPKDCPLFARVCTPENPVGACMVSSEGACAAYYLYGYGVGRK